jgi:hypothetical protein
MATVVPIALWSRIAPAVAQTLRRTHSYTYNGRSITVKITQVEVRRKGEAAFAAQSPRPAGRTQIIDGDGRTIKLALFADGAYRSGATLDQMGVEMALDNVDKGLVGAWARPITLAERLQLQDAMQAGQPFSIVGGNQRVRIEGVVRKQFDASAAAAIWEIHAKVKVVAAEQILAVGGAAYGPFFGAAWRLAEQPELANAYGALAALSGSIGKGGMHTTRTRR